MVKLSHLLGPQEQTTITFTLDHPISNHKFQIKDYYIIAQIWSKIQIIEGYAELENFFLHCAAL